MDLPNDSDSEEQLAPPPSQAYSPPSTQNIHINHYNSAFTEETNSSTYTPAAVEPDFDRASNEEPFLPKSENAGVVLHRKPTDVAFTVLFALAFLAMILTGIIIHQSKKGLRDSLEQPITNALFDLLGSSLGLLFGILIMEVVIGALWIVSFRRLVRVSVWITVTVTPFALFAGGLWSIIVGAQHVAGVDGAMITYGVFMLIGGLSFAALVLYQRSKILVSIQILQLACTVLQHNPLIFVVALAMSLLYMAFSIVWVYQFGWLFYTGFPSEQEGRWVLSGNSYVAMLYFIFVYFWTTRILHSITSYTLAGTTCHWFYHRNDIVRNQQNPINYFFKAAITTSFGSIAFASLVLATVRFMRMLLDHVLRRIAQKSQWAACCLSGIIRLIEMLVNKVTAFSLVHMAASGDSFCTSTNQVMALFKRTLRTRLLVDAIATWILFVWNTVLASFCALGAYTFAAQVLHSSYAWVMALIAFAFASAIMQFYTGILLNIVDALFICYLRDCDVTNTVADMQRSGIEENPDVHSVFGAHIKPTKTVNPLEVSRTVFESRMDDPL